MATMIERVARAICNASGIDPDRKYKSSDYSERTSPHEFAWHEFQPEARAAIEAMRNPTEQVADAFIGLDGEESWALEPERSHEFFGTLQGFRESWNDALDAALKDDDASQERL